MNAAQYIKDIQSEIKDKNYDDYVHAFYEYKEYLENHIKENTGDIEAVCQLAAVNHELRCETIDSTSIMEELLLCAADILSEKDKARIYTNLAFLYEDDYDEENCLRCLKEAVALNTDLPNAYDALGRLYLYHESNENAIVLFERACALSNELKYRYNYGTALFNIGNISKAKTIFEALLSEDCKERRTLYAFGVCCIYMGEKAKALKIADKLALEESDDYISDSEIADLYFLCDDYLKHTELYDKGGYAFDANWLTPYFYSLKALNDKDTLEKKFVEAVSQNNYDIAQAQEEELDETYTESDKSEYIQKLHKEKQDIIKAYNDIKDNDYIPCLEIKLWLMCGCYLIDCPRHQCI